MIHGWLADLSQCEIDSADPPPLLI
jgi:hypothetical protein